ncbi:MAG: hypothetical protein QOF42_3666 [Gammaproteobacteria bacterium]|jgi:hypothetical protein|nr:hypothetical protein [Gammaproteobacteria bacterium]
MFAVMDENTGGGVPQFTTAEYGSGAAANPCKACGKPIGGNYYQVNGVQVCTPCTDKIKTQFPADSHSAFVRGLLFGIGGAIVGLALYVAVALGTGLVIGIVSLAVGFIVGKSMVFGSGGVRGRRYQIAAVALTYAAVSLSAVPVYISQQMKHRSEVQAQLAEQHGASSDAASSATAQRPGALRAIGVLVLLGLASPFLDMADPAHGLIGLVILFVGIRIAWKLTAEKQVNIVGPLNAAPTAV